MNSKLLNYWNKLRSSFWFLPSLMATVATLLAFGLLTVDDQFAEAISKIPFVYTGGAEGTRGLLSAIAGSSITVAGTTFSITVAVLTLASSTYGPRVLRTFTSNTGNQVVLGTFVATFMYSIIVLRAVRSAEEDPFVPPFLPHLSTTFAIGLAIADIAVLIYFIHHITTSIQASSIVAEVGDDLNKAIERIYPARIGHGAAERKELHGEADTPPDFEHSSTPINATGSGYVQTLDNEQLLKVTTEHDLIVKIQHRPGTFVVEGNELLRAWPSAHVTDDLTARFNNLFTFGKERTLTQDVEFGIWQLADVAIRALSPSLNDPYTAVNCLDQHSVALCNLADRDFPSRYRYDDDNNLRVITNPVTFERLLDVAFDEIRQNGNKFVMVLNKILDVIGKITTRVHTTEAIEALRQHAVLVERSSHEGISSEHERQKVERRFQSTMHIIAEREQQLLQEEELTAA
jgi:uncharacterized membrane protein